jgi:hypothetical protein
VRRHHPDLAFDVPDGAFAGPAPVRGRAFRLGRFGRRLLASLMKGRFLLVLADLAYATGYASFLLSPREPTLEELS